MNIKEILEGKRIGVFDAETNGFLENMTEMLCATVIDANTKGILKSADCQDAPTLIAELDKYDVLAGHNIIGFDLPMLFHKYGWRPRKDVIILDTLWLSRMYNPDIEGGHSLGAWGERLGNPKKEYYPVLDPDQPCFNPELSIESKKELRDNPGWPEAVYTRRCGEYCDQDVLTNVDLFWMMVRVLVNFTWQSIKCEMDTAQLIQRQMEHGFVFDLQSAEKLHAALVSRKIELEEEVQETFKPRAILIREVQPKVKLDSTVSSVGLKQIENWQEVIPVPDHERWTKTIPYDHLNEFTQEIEQREREIKHVDYFSGSFSLIEWPEFNLGSRQQIAERLLLAGYKLTKKTDKGTYIIDDEVLETAADAGIPEAKPLAEYFMITKREGMVRDWIERAKKNEDQGVYRIHGFVNSLGAATNRMTHNSPNVAQVPAGYSTYGKECRSLYTVRKGYKLVGCDASGLELRCLAHYMNDPAYTKELLEGDIHTANQNAAGLPTRDNAKTFIYAFLYGAGDLKIGQIVGGNSKQGKELKAKFLEATPALKKLRGNILKAANSRDWLRGVDGRIIRIRSPHAALNTLLQGMGAIVMKYWLIRVAELADAEGLEWYPQANVHDEGQFEVADKDVKRFCEICEAAFPWVGEMLGLNCRLDGEAQVGNTWYETH